MSKLRLFIFTIMCWTLNAQNTIVVDNNPGSLTTYKTLQAAYDAASNNDIIHLIPSNTSYGKLTPNGSTKKLSIYGNGYFLTANPNKQAILLTSKVDGITFDAGMAGSLVSGVEFLGALSGTYYAIICNSTNGIIIKRNLFTMPLNSINYIQLNGTSTNITISQNYADAGYVGYVRTFLIVGASCSDILIYNNHFGLYGSASYLLFNISVSAINVSVFNNILNATIGSVGFGSANVYNNILKGGAVSGGSSISNNLCNATQFPNANGNIQNVNMSNEFVGGSSTDGQWQLKAGAQAIGAGLNGVNCGMFGGDFPYVLSGIPAIPSIYSFIAPGLIKSNTTSINLQVQIKSNK